MADFVALSQESVNRYRESIGSSEYNEYRRTLYVAISEFNEVTCAYDPEILKDAYQCILIHCRAELAITNWYYYYKVEYINHNGLNLERIIGNDCYIEIVCGAGRYETMTLYHRDEDIYSCRLPFEGHMQGLWDAYCNTLNTGQNDIALLRAELHRKEEHIHDLELQVNQYRRMLAGIKEIVSKFEE